MIKGKVSSFFKTVGSASESLYLLLLTLYVIFFFYLKIAFTEEVFHITDLIRYTLLGIVTWGMAAYLLYIIAEWLKLWKKTFLMVLTGAILIGCTMYFSRIMSTNSYGVVFDIIFCLLAYGKSFRKMLKCMLGGVIGILIVAGIGVPLGFTFDIEKPNYITQSHSLGINYPNTWGYMVFLALMLLWYLYLRFKPALTFLIFWSICVVMYFNISCNTIAGLTAVFPILALLVDFLEKKRGKEHPGEEKIGVIGWICTLSPFIAFTFMYIVSINYKWVHSHFYSTGLRNLAMRFVQGGLYFKTYGLPLFGNPYRSNVTTLVDVNGDFLEVGILDSSFAAYMIMRGMIWLICILVWLCIANWKAIKNKDYAIPFLEMIILIFAMMERPGLEMWYNFVLLYPLVKDIDDRDIKSFFEQKKINSSSVCIG